MSENICENSKVFDSLKTNITEDSKTDLEEANILYNNAKFYYTTGELNGALVSYSCSAVLLNSLVRKLKQKDISEQANLTAVNDATKILNCCLSAVQELQGKVKKMSSGSKSGGKDEEKKDWEKICTNLQPLVFKDGSSDCLFFDDVAGLKKEKELLKSSLIYPLSYPNLYPKTAKGILIYGPPGTGKTYIVKAAVNELQKTDPNIAVLFFAPSPGDLKGKYVGETEKKIEEWFTCASKAACDAQLDCKEKKQYISIMFMDEFDAIGPDRSQDTSGFAANSVNTLLQMMDGIASKKNVTVVAATNYPWSLDSAILRRFDTQILISLPSKSDINQVLDIEMKKIIKLKDDPDTDAYCRSERKLLANEESKDKTESDNCSSGCTKTAQKNIINEAPYNQMVYDFYDTTNAAFFAGFVSSLQEKHYSNSDVTRLVKSAATYSGQLAISNNLFYSTDTILNYNLDTPKYISSLTKLKDKELGFKLSVDTLNSYLGNGDIPSSIYEITSPEIVQITYNEKKYINVKCLFYKNNDLLINDVKIKDIYIEFDGDINKENYEKMYNKPIEESRELIISYNFAMKEKDNVQNFEQRSILPVSKKLIEIVFQPIYEAIKVVNTNIQTFEMLDASLSDLLERKSQLEGKEKEYMDIKRKLGNTNENALKCIRQFKINDVLKIIKDMIGSKGNTEVAAPVSEENGIKAAKKYALDMFGIQVDQYQDFKRIIEENEIFDVTSTTNFFNMYLVKILENQDILIGIRNSILTRVKKDNVLQNNYYDFYNYLLLYKISKDTPNSDIIDASKVVGEPVIDLYLNSLQNSDNVSLITIDAADLVVETLNVTSYIQQLNSIGDITDLTNKLNTLKGKFTNLIGPPDANDNITKDNISNKFNSLPKVHTIFFNLKNNLQLPVYLIEYYNSNEAIVKNNEILIDIKQYITFISEFNLINKLGFFNIDTIKTKSKLYVKIEIDLFIEIFNKYINIRQFIINYNEIITKNQKKIDKDIKKFNENNFTKVEQQLIQIYLNDIFNFCKLIDRMSISDDTATGPATGPATTAPTAPNTATNPPAPNTLVAPIANTSSNVNPISSTTSATTSATGPKIGGAPDDKPKIKEQILQEYLKKLLNLPDPLKTINLLEIISMRIHNNYDFVHFEKICVFDKYWDKKSHTFVAIDYKVFNTPTSNNPAVITKSKENITAFNSLRTKTVNVPIQTAPTTPATQSFLGSISTASSNTSTASSNASQSSVNKLSTENPSSKSLAVTGKDGSKVTKSRDVTKRVFEPFVGSKGGKSLKHIKKHKTFSKNKSLKKIYRGGAHASAYQEALDLIMTGDPYFNPNYESDIISKFEKAVQAEEFDNAPELLETYKKYGDFLVDKAKRKEALDIYQKALALDENDAYLNEEIGKILYRLGEFDKSCPYFYKALDLYTTQDDKGRINLLLQDPQLSNCKKPPPKTPQEIEVDIQKIFTKGDELMASANYDGAKAKYNEINSIAQATEENKRVLAEKIAVVDSAIANKNKKDGDINKIFADGDTLMANKKYAEARAKYNEVKNVAGFTDADGITLAGKLKALDNAIKTEITEQTTAAFKPETTKYLFGFIKLSGSLRTDSEDTLKSVIETAKSQGDTSVNYINAVNNLAKFYRIKVDLVKAEEQYKIALQACDKLLKDQQDRKATIKDVSTFNTINNLGVLYLDQGILDTEKGFNSNANLKYKKAMYLFKRNLFVYQDDIANSSNWTANIKLNYALVIFYIAETLSQMKKIPEAFVMYSKAKEIVDPKNIVESSLPQENKETLITLINTLNYKTKTKIKLDNNLTFDNIVQSFRASYEKEAEEVMKEEKDQADVKIYEAYVNKDASDVYIKIELYGLIGFCTGFGEIDITKKIANKTIFIKTILDLSKFKEAAKKGGIWSYFKEHMSSYGEMIKKLFSNKTDEELKKSKTDNILMEITKKNLLSSLFINNVSGLGFLLDNNSINIVDDSIIFNSGNTSTTIRWIDISPGSGFYKHSSSMLTGIQKVIGERSLEAVLGSLGVYGFGALTGYTATGAVVATTGAVAAATSGTAVGTAAAYVSSGVAVTISTIGWPVAIASVVIIVGAEVYAYTNQPNPNSVLNNLLAKYIYTFITDGSIDVDSLEGVDPTQAFINNLCDIISITEGAFFKATLIKTSRRLTYNYQEAILTEGDKDQMAIFSKQNVNKLSIDKKLLTNLNIPIKAFAHALMEVKSTDVKENRLKLEEYYENKDAVLEKLKKEREKR